MNQSTSHILMIWPVNFGFNEETAVSNAFQKQQSEKDDINVVAQLEFDGMVKMLCTNGVEVIVVEDTIEPHKPDAIFPNNWVSFHDDGTVFLYPMQAENRRLERREDIISRLENHFSVKHIIDLSRFELEDKFLEGTGSIVLDRQNKMAYACISPRTDREVLDVFCEQVGYKAITFDAVGERGQAIYHTNVLMCLGSQFAVICLECISNPHERVMVRESLTSTKKEIIEISFEQVNQFAGNMLEVKNKAGETLIVLSQNAYNSLFEDQKNMLKQFGKLAYADIGTIESVSGGSARCMMAEVYLPVGS
jgi:hypothetical protein